MDQFMPLTLHVTTLEDEEWTSFKAAFTKHAQDEDEAPPRTSILKPASMSNRASAFAWRTTWRRRTIVSTEARKDARCGRVCRIY